MVDIRPDALADYPDVLTPEVVAALHELAPLDDDRHAVMAARLARRAGRAANGERIAFLDPAATIARTRITVADARAGAFTGSAIPADLQRQWIQGTGPGAKPSTPVDKSIRNISYALLSGADGWMFDGEDALGQLSTMALDNQRNLKLAIHREEVFLKATEAVAAEMNAWAQSFFGRTIVGDWQKQLGFTTKIFRARGLHLDDRHVRRTDGRGFSASIVDLATFVVNNHARLRAEGSSLVLYLPKIQTAEEAALWHDILSRLEAHLGLPIGAVKAYVLVEQLEAVFQLMEIRAALGPRFVGFNTGRWDYINSVSDALAWDPSFINPNIDAITMTYGYMRNYEDRVRRAVNTPDEKGQFALWQGGMEPNIPVGSAEGVSRAMQRAVAGGEREQREGASGKWVAHWKMVHIVRPVWEKVGQANQLGRAFATAHLHGRGCRGSHAARAGPAHRARRPGSPERRHPVRQRLRAGHAGGRAQAGRLLRQRGRALPDGRHGHGRDPPEHPVGVAAQGREVHRGRRRRGCESGRRLHGRFLPAAARRGVRQAAARRQPRRARQLEDDHAADRA